jgi:hypothetical protein
MPESDSLPPRPFLVSSTRSPLANPKTPVHRLAVGLQSSLHFPDPSPLYAVTGTIAANMLRGYPVWLMMIGPPESGKTELLKPLLRLQGILECGDLSGKAALLSGTRAKDCEKDATGGVLARLEVSCNEIDGVDFKRGALIMLDFARTVLAGDSQAIRSNMGALGMLHDQHWQRELGTDGGKTLSFRGRIGFIAATTDVIDRDEHSQANSEMGERCLYYRYPDSSGFHEISNTLDNPDGSNKGVDIQKLFMDWWIEITGDGCSWDDLTPPRHLTSDEKQRVIALARFCARARSGVQRDKYNKNEVTGLAKSALGPRIANTLAQLLRGMERIGCTPAEIWRVLTNCAMDSMPAVRAYAIKLLLFDEKTGVRKEDRIIGPDDLAEHLSISVSTARRTLEDLKIHKLLAYKKGAWTLSDLAKSLLKAGWVEED